MNALRTIALAAVATLASLPAFSNTIALGTLAVPSTTPLPTQVYSTTVTFTDYFTFTIDAAAGSMALTTQMNFDTVIPTAGKVTLTSMQLQTGGGAVLGTGTISGTTIIGNFGTISAGSYRIAVTGSSIAGSPGGSYGGSLGLTAVPEPGTLALFGLGLAVAGFAGRRGRKTQVA